MKRLLSIIGSLFSLLLLAGLTIVVVFFNQGQQQETLSANLFQSPIRTPVAPPKPTQTGRPFKTPPTPPPLPSVVASVTSIGVTPVLPTATPTVPATDTPTPKPPFNPTATNTPVVIPTSVGPLPPGPKLVYGETDGASGTTDIWLASAKNPRLRKLLATVKHKMGYDVRGIVSPDGSKIAYHIIPPGTSERGARTDGGELWVMNADGTNPRLIAKGLAYLANWSPDSHTLTFGRRILSKSDPASSISEFKTELYMITIDGTDPKLLLTDDIVANFSPLGWSDDGQTYYYFAPGQSLDKWELWNIGIADGSIQFQTVAPFDKSDVPILLPNGSHVIFTAPKPGEKQLSLIRLSIDGKEQETIANGATGTGAINSYILAWALDGKEIVFHIPPEGEKKSRLERFDFHSKEKTPIVTPLLESEEFFVPRSWSPDKEWIVVRKYPHRPQSLTYLMRTTGGAVTQLPLAQPSNWVYLFGWTNE